MKLRSTVDVDKALRPYLEVAAQVTGKQLTVQRMERLMAYLGNPERSLRVIHAAGTSGKTSTTYFIAQLLTETGLKVGHTVSPHVVELNERVQLGGKPIPKKMLHEELSEFLERIQDAPETPSWFECMLAFALWFFAKQKVDYVVVETGMGGLHDASNVLARQDKLCVLTDIGFDHMHVLGERLGAIAHQKAGIIHEGNSALMYEQTAEIMQVVRYWVSQQEGAELYTFTEPKLQEVYGEVFPLHMPKFQKRNWLLAYATYRFLCNRDSHVMIDVKKLAKTQRLQVPARMEAHSEDGKKIIFDGAHNGQKMTALVESFQEQYPGRKVPMLLALKQGKEISDLAPLIKNIASSVVVTTFKAAQDVPVFSVAPNEIVAVLKKHGVQAVAVPEQKAAYESFLSLVDDVGLVTGSFYLIGQLRSQLS
ncbi:MAG: Mur ligase family protein [Candidatus Saccharimonadales bacterium]